MTIRQLRIQNFKCFEDQPFPFGSLTLLSGLNGTGKSSVLQSLLLLRQSFQQRLLQTVGLALNGDLIQLGTAKDVFYEGATTDQFGFDLDFGEQLAGVWRFGYDKVADVVRLASKPVPAHIYEQNLFGDRFHYLSAERVGPRAFFTMSDYLVREHHQIGVRGEYTPHFLGLFGGQKITDPRLAHPSENAQILKAQVEAWMGEVSPGVRIELKTYTEVDLISIQFAFVVGGQISNPYRSTHVGFGITYTLPIVVALLASEPGTLVLLENPEAHLHPSGQFQMGMLMARAAACGVQIVVETHSDHILNGVRVAVREQIMSPAQLRIYFLGRQRESGQLHSRVMSPQVDVNGRLDQWPDGFFDEWDKSLEKLL